MYCIGSLTCLPGLDLASSLLIRCNTVSVTYQLYVYIGPYNNPVTVYLKFRLDSR